MYDHRGLSAWLTAASSVAVESPRRGRRPAAIELGRARERHAEQEAVLTARVDSTEAIGERKGRNPEWWVRGRRSPGRVFFHDRWRPSMIIIPLEEEEFGDVALVPIGIAAQFSGSPAKSVLSNNG